MCRAHKRPFGEAAAPAGTVAARAYRRAYYQYHHFHMDLDDVQIDETGVWAHPLWGSVLYVSTTGGGPTLIVEQTKHGRRPWHARPDQVNGTLITPQQGAFARWRGDRLHAVLPPSPPKQCGEAGEEQCEAREGFTERITLTAAFWAGRECVSRGGSECARDRVPTSDQRAFYWQQEFPLAEVSESARGEWWQSGFNPGAAGSTPRPPSEPRRLAPVALRRVWAPSEAEESPGGHNDKIFIDPDDL